MTMTDTTPPTQSPIQLAHDLAGHQHLVPLDTAGHLALDQSSWDALSPDERTQRAVSMLGRGEAAALAVSLGPESLRCDALGQSWATLALHMTNVARQDNHWREAWLEATKDTGAGDVFGRLTVGWVEEAPSGDRWWPFQVPVLDAAEVDATLSLVAATRAQHGPETRAELVWAGHLPCVQDAFSRPAGGPDAIVSVDWDVVYRLADALSLVSDVPAGGAPGTGEVLDSDLERVLARLNAAALTADTVRMLTQDGWIVTQERADGEVRLARGDREEAHVGGPRRPRAAVWAWSPDFSPGGVTLGAGLWSHASIRAAIQHGGSQPTLAATVLGSREVVLPVSVMRPVDRPTIELNDHFTTAGNGLARALVGALRPDGTPFVVASIHPTTDAFLGFVGTGSGQGLVRWGPRDRQRLAVTVAQPIKKGGRGGPAKEHSFPATVLDAAMAEAERECANALYVAEGPILLPNGRVLTSPGYYRAEQALVAIPRRKAAGWAVCRVPETPAQEEAQQALEAILADVMGDFPFATQSDQARAVAYLLTCAARGITGVTPGFLIDAPDRGSGKGLLAAVGRIIGSGRSTAQSIPVSAAGVVPSEEASKIAVTAMLGGCPYLHIDEAPRGQPIRSTALQEWITQDGSSSLRVLGGHHQVTLSGHIVTITGNNVALGGDLMRRFIPIRLSWQGSGLPHERGGFRHPDLLEYVQQHRPEILGWCYTILAHGLQVGARTTVRHGSFEAWVRVVLGSLSRVTIDGQPCDLLTDADRTEWSAAQDDEGAEWLPLMRAWHTMVAEDWVQVGDITPKLAHRSPPIDLPGALVREYDQGATSQQVRWGKALLAREGTKVRDLEGGCVYAVEVRRDSKRGNRYRVVRASETQAHLTLVDDLAVAQ